MTTSTAMDINTFCPVSKALYACESEGTIWIKWTDQLRDDLMIAWDHRLYLPQSDWDGPMLEGQGPHEPGDFISEAGFYKLVFASEASAAQKFKAWVLDELLLKWFQETADPEYVYRMNQIKSGDTGAELSVVIVATEILPVSRRMP